MRFGRLEIGSRLRPICLLHSRGSRHWLGLAIGWNGEASGLQLVGLLGIAIMPNGGNFCLLAPRSVHLGELRLTSALLLNISLDHLRSGASCIVSMLAFFQQHGNHDLGIAPGRYADKPAIILKVLPFGPETLLSRSRSSARCPSCRRSQFPASERWELCPSVTPPAPARQ